MVHLLHRLYGVDAPVGRYILMQDDLTDGITLTTLTACKPSWYIPCDYRILGRNAKNLRIRWTTVFIGST